MVGKTVKLEIVRNKERRTLELRVAEAPDRMSPGPPRLTPRPAPLSSPAGRLAVRYGKTTAGQVPRIRRRRKRQTGRSGPGPGGLPRPV